MIRFRCPQCDSQMEVDESFAGRPARCPTCGAGLRVPKAGEAAPGPAAPARPGAATVRIDGQQVQVVAPLETMVVVSLAFVGAAVALPLLIGLVLSSLFQYPWTIGMALGAVGGLMGLLIGVPAYHNVRHSRGRRRGRTHALIAMAAGGALFLIFTVGAIVGFARVAWRAPCEDNLKHIYTALRNYAGQHDGAFPKSLEDLVRDGYLEKRDWLTCPAYRVQVGTPTYVLATEINLDARTADGKPYWPSDTMIVSDGPPYDAHGDGYVRALLLDGQIKSIPEGEWAVYQKAQIQKWNDILNKIRNPKRSAEPESDAAPAAAPAPGTPGGGS